MLETEGCNIFLFWNFSKFKNFNDSGSNRRRIEPESTCLSSSYLCLQRIPYKKHNIHKLRNYQLHDTVYTGLTASTASKGSELATSRTSAKLCCFANFRFNYNVSFEKQNKCTQFFIYKGILYHRHFCVDSDGGNRILTMRFVSDCLPWANASPLHPPLISEMRDAISKLAVEILLK